MAGRRRAYTLRRAGRCTACQNELEEVNSSSDQGSASLRAQEVRAGLAEVEEALEQASKFVPPLYKHRPTTEAKPDADGVDGGGGGCGGGARGGAGGSSTLGRATGIADTAVKGAADMPPWMSRPAVPGAAVAGGPSASDADAEIPNATTCTSWEAKFAANLDAAGGASGTASGPARTVPAAVAAVAPAAPEPAGGGDGFEEEEEMVNVAGVPKPIGAVTEEDQGRMSEEEHARYFELCQAYMEQ